MGRLLGGIEAGGTKFVCAVGTESGQILAQERFPTALPEETLGKAVAFFQEQELKFGTINALGVASFGPLDPNPESEKFGYITSTPKPGWANCNIVGILKKVLRVPIGFDTDVDGAALGEWRWGAGVGLDSLVYLTIGTGIGGGAITNGQIIHGLLHTEMGHMRIAHDIKKDPFEGNCPYHQDCWEGLACGPAIEQRWGVRAEYLPKDHQAWGLEAEYIAMALVNLILILSPNRIILGGGVMSQKHLFPLIRQNTHKLLNGYIKTDTILNNIQDYIVPPGLGSASGVLGAIGLADLALE